ncbi:hypothetical protein STRTUCAR8_03317 [Streptomyces turgidiscabies Car8]|uniref:Uncharacterized protein n=1 Tax=Streptomyces turgidiscabies (strain Car8) TaxID=698760 RepID=L7F2R2_STRT8|nr:hypothetical protein STRTUCAR8_03317 [Streptomyces turgidiscabies Car8]
MEGVRGSMQEAWETSRGDEGGRRLRPCCQAGGKSPMRLAVHADRATEWVGYAHRAFVNTGRIVL